MLASISADAIVFWVFALAWIVVGGQIVFVQVPRLVRELGRIVRHVLALINQSALTTQLAKAEADVDRIQAAIHRLPALRKRASAAVDRLRGTPLVPPSVAAVTVRIEGEIRAFTQATR